MQLLCRFDTDGWDDWKSRFDDDSEIRGQHGLTLLQLWRDAETPDAAVVLFEAADEDKARAWVDRQTGFGHALRADFLNPAL